MADIPITREEKYLAYLTGDYKADIPKPITRQERYLYELCLKGMGGEISPEEIQKAVNEYLEKNPVKPGATTEQAQQIEQNKTDIASLKTETGSLKEDISTKITKFYASNQGKAHLADSDNGKIQDMMLYGKSEQKQYSGKNLLNATLRTTTQNGVTCTANGDGTYTVNGTATGNCYFRVGMSLFKSAKKYKVIGCPTGGSEKTYYLGYDKPPWYSDIGTGQSFTFNGDTDEQISLTIGIKSSTVCNNLLFKPMIVDASLYPDTTYNDFEPYTGGQPSPSPDYPQEIKSVKNPTVKVCGKNLFDSKKFPIILNRAIDTNTGVVYESSGGKYCATEKYIPFPYGGKIISFNASMSLCTYDKDYKFISAIRYHSQAPFGTTYVRFDIKIEDKDKAQIELSENTTAYEPYHEQTVTLPYTLNAIPVNSGGNVTIDEQQYIADYVDVERGKLVRMVGSYDLGLLDYEYITVWGSGNEGFRCPSADRYDFSKKTGIKSGSKLLCNNFIYCGTLSQWKHITQYSNYSIATVYANSVDTGIIIKYSSITDVESFKNAVKGNRIYYELATPEEIDLTEEEVQSLKVLVTYYPITNISVNSEQLDGYTVFNYPISMENGWNYVKQQIGDTRDYIYDMDARTQDTDLQAAEAYVNSEYAVALTELEV